MSRGKWKRGRKERVNLLVAPAAQRIAEAIKASAARAGRKISLGDIYSDAILAYYQDERDRLDAEIRSLAQEQARISEQIKKLQEERDHATNTKS